MIHLVKPAYAFYDDDLPPMLVLLSYRNSHELLQLVGEATTVYGTYRQPEQEREMVLAAISPSSYEQVHMTVDRVIIIDTSFDLNNYVIFEGDVASVVSMPGVSETFPLSDRALLVKSEKQVVLPEAKPLISYASSASAFSQTTDEPVSPTVPTAAENRIVVLVVVITLLIVLVTVVFFILKRRKKDDISKYY